MFSLRLSKPQEFRQVCHNLFKCHQGYVQHDRFNLLPLGFRLAENIKLEWTRSNVIFREHNVFVVQEPISSTKYDTKPEINSLKILFECGLPLGIAFCRRSLNESALNEDNTVIQAGSEQVLHHLCLMEAQSAKQFYFRWQLQRKTWWRIFSCEPGRFRIEEEQGKDECKIVADFPWGYFVLEKISYLGESWKNTVLEGLENKLMFQNGRRKTTAHLVESSLSLEVGALMYMCDALAERGASPVMAFHRKIAPYKFAFAVVPESERVGEMVDACRLVCLELRKRGVDCFSPGQKNTDLKATLSQLDLMGVPYTVIASEDTLNSGILTIRDRDTLIAEEVHISRIVSHCENLLRNYEIKNF